MGTDDGDEDDVKEEDFERIRRIVIGEGVPMTTETPETETTETTEETETVETQEPGLPPVVADPEEAPSPVDPVEDPEEADPEADPEVDPEVGPGDPSPETGV